MRVFYTVSCPTPISEKGFSLLEVLIGLLVLAVALSGLIGMQMTALRLNNANLEQDVARDVLQRVIDETKILSNPELRAENKSNLLSGGVDSFSALPTDYKMTGIDTSLPSDYNFTRWKGYTETKMSGGSREYTVKLDVDEQYLLQDVLARAQVTAYWRPTSECRKRDGAGNCIKTTMSARPVDMMHLVFFIERK